MRLTIIKNEEENIYVDYDHDSDNYIVHCNCLVSEERAYKYGESCYRTKTFKYQANAMKFYDKLVKMSKKFIIQNQDKLFGKK